MSGTHPEHWNSYTGPANWYRIWHPPNWELEETDSKTCLHLPEGRGSLLLNCFWGSADQDVGLESVALTGTLLTEPRKVRSIKPLDVGDESIALEGEALEGPPRSWWKRTFSRKVWHRWRSWVVRRNPICLVAVFRPSREPDPELETMVRMILNTLELADEPADPPQVFAQRVRQLARGKFPLLACEPGEDFQLRLGESSINLYNFYRSYVNDPRKFEEIVLPALTTVVQVQEWGKDQTEPPLDRVRERIMPMLYPEAVYRESFPNFSGMPWVAGLMILYVVDESQSYWYIREDMLQQWGIEQHDLHRMALENLDDYFEKNAMEFTLVGEEDGQRLLMPNRADSYNSARILSESFHQTLQELLGPEVAVGLPNRDFLIAASLDSQETIDQIRHKVAEDYAQMDHPLCERLLLVSSDGVSQF